MSKIILVFLLFTGCSSNMFAKPLQRGHCYTNDSYDVAFKVTSILQHGAMMKVIKRAPTVYISCGKETEQPEAYVSWDVLERIDKFLYEIDCEAYDKMRKE